MSMKVAVVAHGGKTFGGGLGELRRVLARSGYKKPLWYEVPKSAKAPKAVRRAVEKGADLIFVWGGDGMVQRCIDALAGHRKVALAILPAGTANLFASNLGIPRDIRKAVNIGLGGLRRRVDVGVVNHERFAVMAGAGFDASMIRDADGAPKKRMGRLAYLRGGVRAMNAKRLRVTIRVDGHRWFEGKASAVLLGNVGTVTGGVEVFPDASISDGMLELGVVTASSKWEWLRVFSRLASGHVERSPFVQRTRGKKIVVEFNRKADYELDGGLRPPTRRLRARVKAGALTLCVPRARAAKRPERGDRPARPRRSPPPASRMPADNDRPDHASDGAPAAPDLAASVSHPT
jgi:diacylglycerol kinase (ATP)